jgi:predicted permease
MILVAQSLVPVFLAIAMGAALTHFRVLTREHWVGVEKVTYHVLFPALIIETLARVRLTGSEVLAVAAATGGGVVIMSVLVIVLRRPLERAWGVDGPAFTSIYQGAARWNSFTAIALAGILYGRDGTLATAIAIVAMVPLLNIIAVALLVRHARGTPVTAAVFGKTLITNPFIWPTLVGLAVNLEGLPLPGVAQATLDMLGKASLGLGLLMVGGGLDLASGLKVDRPVALAIVLKLVVMPAIVLAIALGFGLSGPLLGATLLCAAVPTAAASYVLARQMGGDAPLVARIVTVQTLVAMLTLPVWLMLVS